MSCRKHGSSFSSAHTYQSTQSHSAFAAETCEGGEPGPCPSHKYGRHHAKVGGGGGGGGPTPLILVAGCGDETSYVSSEPTKGTSASPFKPRGDHQIAYHHFEWREPLDLVIASSGVVLARLLFMGLDIWENGDWTLSYTYRTWANVQIMIDVDLCDASYVSLCRISTREINLPGGVLDCRASGGSSRSISEFFAEIVSALRSTTGTGPWT